ncbi:MAG: general secretion pathway protein GspL [Rubrivivax sp.]|nr:general secretion pathway protein GspL [Rubrivivax sp.]
MSLLVILLPPRPRAESSVDPLSDFAFVLSSDGSSVTRQGLAPAGQLPRADHVSLLLTDADVSWQRVAVPKAPAARLRDALGAVLEDQLLDDDDAVHLALEPGLAGGRSGWVAVTDKAWLTARLAELEAAGITIDRVLPSSWPSPLASLHGLHDLSDAGSDGASPRLVWSHADGVSCTRLAGSLARQQLAGVDRSQLRCSAHPAAVAAVEAWLEVPVAVLGDAERALLATRSGWNLRQFDLARRHRGMKAVREGLRRLAGPDWRALRYGAVALLLVQLAGLNLWAWRLEQTVQDKRQAMTRLLQTAHPQVRAVLDAPLQMQRETELLRAAAGRAGPNDLEPLLAVAATAWPAGQPPMQALRFEPGRLSITPVGWGAAQRAQFSDRVRAAGYRAESQSGQLVISRESRS